MKPTKRFKLFADFGQIHVCDAKAAGSLEDAWTPGASEDRIADRGDIVGIGAKDSDDVDVSVEICKSAPKRDAAAWDHVTESSIDVASGELAVLGCTDELRKARRFPVEAGVWRIRASHANLAKGREWIRLQIWAAPRRAPRVVKRWVPPLKAQPKGRKRIASAKQAVRAALRGETDAALEFLLPRAKDGDFDASASTMQLLAFRGQWRELVPLAMNVIAKEPDADAARQICCTACDLLWRASTELEDPSIIGAAAAKLVQTMKSEASPRLHGERELPKKATAEDRRRFVEFANDPKFENRYRGKPHHRVAHLMAYARLHLGLEDETLTLWDPENEELGFDDAVWIADVHARRGDTRRAWETLESRLTRWWPLTIWDVAPVGLLVHPTLAPLMTRQRCEEILSTVRGDEAE